MNAITINLKPAYVPVIDRRVVDPRNRMARASVSRMYVTATGAESPDCSNAFATRDRAVAVAMIKGVDGGHVLEWMLSDRRISALSESAARQNPSPREARERADSCK